MTVSEFCNILTEFSRTENIPFRHCEFTKPTSAPCMVWLENEGENIHADSVNVFDDISVRLELYIKPTDRETAPKIEHILRENGLTYDRDRTWISERHEEMIIYDICI